MKTLTSQEIMSAISSVKGGTIARIAYKTDVPLKAEFKKQGYKLTRVVETSVRCGVDYHKISSVIARKSSADYVPSTRKNNYEWVIKNRVKHNTNTEKDYVVVATLPSGDNTKVKYILDGTFVGTIDMGDSIDNHYTHLVIDSYFKNKESSSEVKTISFDNVLRINNTGKRIIF